MTRWEYCLFSASNIYRPFHWDVQIPSSSYFECTVHCFLRFSCYVAAALYLCAVLPLSHTFSHTSFPASGDHSALLRRHEVSFWVCLLEAPWPPLGWSHHLCFGLSSWSDVSKMLQMKLWLWISAPDGTPSCLSDNCMWNLKTVLTLDKTHPISHHAWSETMSPCSFYAIVNSLIYLHPSLGSFFFGVSPFSHLPLLCILFRFIFN